MKQKIKKLLTVISLGLVFVTALPGARAEETQEQLDFLNRLQTELNLSKADYNQVVSDVDNTQRKLDTIKSQKSTLSNQVAYIDSFIENTDQKLKTIIKQMVERENEIKLINVKIAEKETAVEYQKSLLNDYMRLIYVEQNTYMSVGPDGVVDPLKMLLADGSVSGNLNELKYLSLLNEAGQQMLEKLDVMNEELRSERYTLSEVKDRLEALKERVEAEKQQMQIQKDAKNKLLELTAGQESIYSELLEQSIVQKEEVYDAVNKFEETVLEIRTKIKTDGENFKVEDYLDLLDYRIREVYRFRFAITSLEGGGFQWPVTPARGISAYFRDADYVTVFGMNHNAVDVPTAQRTPVRSAGDGVVYVAKDNGYGYSYIIVAHNGEFMTIYGHMNEILVKPGDTVAAGSVIGFSGGMPGTLGAGYMTTGPHLHFEMMKDGKHVDPLDYLPLAVLTEDFAMTMPQQYKVRWEQEVMGMALDRGTAVENEDDVEIEDFEGVAREMVVEDFEGVAR